MSYVDPTNVTSPKNSLKSVEVVYNRGPQKHSWSVAKLEWGERQAVGIRWNGEEGPGIGNPQSRGLPTWFVLPCELEAAVLKKIEELNGSAEGGLLAGYKEMANDQQRESEAQEWSEGLIGDADAQQR